MGRTTITLLSTLFTLVSIYSTESLAYDYETLKSFCADDSEQILKEKFIKSRQDLASADAKAQDLAWKYSSLKSTRFYLSFTDFPHNLEKKVTIEGHIDVEEGKPVHASYFGLNPTGIRGFSFSTVDGQKISRDLYVSGIEGLCVVKVSGII